MAPSFKSVIIKVTNDCNLRCKYCFVSESVPRNITISDSIISLLFDQLEQIPSEETIHLVWHGGEPTLAGVNFFKRMKDLQKGRNKQYKNYIQTNGTLLTDEIIETLCNMGFEIGLSLDGPPELNDQNRIDKQGVGSFRKVADAMQLLEKHEIPFGILATVSKHNINHAAELYNFCQERGLNLKLSPLYQSGRAILNIDELAITPIEYEQFLSQLADLWFNEEFPISIDPIEPLFMGTLAGEKIHQGCSFTANCHRKFFAIGPTGDLYPCGLYQGFNDFRYGNIFDMTLEDIEYSDVFARLERRSENIEKRCQGCDLYELCYGGCPFQALTGAGDLNKEAPQCKPYTEVTYKMLCHFHEKIKTQKEEKSENSIYESETHKEVGI